MSSEKLGNALKKTKTLALNLLGSVLSRTRVEPIRDAEGIQGMKADWVGNRGENAVEINTPSGNIDIQMAGSNAPSVAYLQHGEKRVVTVRNIKNFSFEFNRETLDRIATPKGAGIAMGIGAGVGLLGWFLMSVMRSLSVPPTKQNDAAIPPVDSGEDNKQSSEEQ